MLKSKSLLILGFVWPEPKSSAAGSRMMQLIELFSNDGYVITFASTAQNLEFSEDLKALGIRTEAIVLNDVSFDVFVKELNPSVVLFDRFMVEEQFGWRVSEQCPTALKILDTEDLHCLRQARQKSVKEEREFNSNDLYSDIAKRELASILRCDTSLMISEYEMQLLQEQFSIARDLLYYLPLFAKALPTPLPFSERKDLVFIGNFLHEPNWDAVQYLSKIIWPLLQPLLPNVKMLIYGAYPTQKVLELHRPKSNFYIMGRAASAQEVIGSARLLVAPIRFGAGIKGKLIEAMQYGTPSITTSIGSEAMHGALPWNGCIEDHPLKFAKATASYYLQQELWEASQTNGYTLLKERYDIECYRMDFLQHISFLTNQLQSHRNKNFIGAILQHHLLSSTKYMAKWIEEKNK